MSCALYISISTRPRSRSDARPDLVTQRRTELWDLLAAGRLNLKYIDLPLGEITKAIDLVATRSNLGRVVLRTR